MKVKPFKLVFLLMAVFPALLISCGGDDDDDGPTFVEEDRAEQQIVDDSTLVAYLTTHYYNSSLFESDEDFKYDDIIITELEEGETVPDGHTLLMDAVETRTTTYLEADYKYYILRLDQGDDEAGLPRFTDQVRVRYEGSNVVGGDVFDSSVTPVDLFLQGNLISTFGTIKGWQLVMPTFNAGFLDGIVNGIVNYRDYGLGVMFIPSGLGYFSGTTTGSSYANLIFKFELLQYQEEDHDNDGIPSYVEDLDNSLEVTDDDTDDNNFPNFIDIDDDGDGVSTFNELVQTEYTEEPILSANEYIYSRNENTGIIITVKAVDDNNNGILDYLDETVTTNYNENETN